MVQQPGLVGSNAQAANAKPKPKPKALAKVSAIASYVGMIQSGPRSSNSFSLQQAFHWDLWMCPLTVEQDQLWKDHPHALTVFSSECVRDNTGRSTRGSFFEKP